MNELPTKTRGKPQLLSEKALRKAKLKPYKNGAKRVVKGVSKAVRTISKGVGDGLNYLAFYEERHHINKDQKKHLNALNGVLSKAEKIRRARAKVEARRRRASKSRLA